MNPDESVLVMSCDAVTEDEINNMRPGQFYTADDGVVHVLADYVTHNQLYFSCPFCRSRYRNDGEPCRNAKYHQHNHSFDPKDFIEREHVCIKRFPHCGPKYNGKGMEIHPFPRNVYNVFCIHITSKTKRKI